MALEGGGAKGAYEAGVLFTFANTTNGSVITYDIISGISICAANVGLASQFAIGNELNMSMKMLHFWQTLNGSNSIYQEWNGGLIDTFCFKKASTTTRPP